MLTKEFSFILVNISNKLLKYKIKLIIRNNIY